MFGSSSPEFFSCLFRLFPAPTNCPLGLRGLAAINSQLKELAAGQSLVVYFGLISPLIWKQNVKNNYENIPHKYMVLLEDIYISNVRFKVKMQFMKFR